MLDQRANRFNCLDAHSLILEQAAQLRNLLTVDFPASVSGRAIVIVLTPEQIIELLREAEVALGQGEKTGVICRRLGISEQSYYRWRREYGGMKVD
jgi:hypothetical protein